MTVKAPKSCPDCGKDLSALSDQAAFGHIGGHKRKKAAVASQPSLPSPTGMPKLTPRKATFTAEVTKQEDLQSYKKPVEAKAQGAKVEERGEAIEGLISLAFARWNDYLEAEATVSGGPPKITAEEIKALASGVRDVLEKHGGLEGVEGIGEYLPEISLLIAAGLIGMKMMQGLRYKAGKRGGTTTFGRAALQAEPPTQSTQKGYEFFEQPHVKKEIEEVFKVAQGQ